MKNLDFKEAALMIQKSNYTVALTGAGMSTESGIPDFRSKGGLWRKHDPTTLASIESLTHHYPLFHQFYKERFLSLRDCQPHQGHYILAKWEKEGLLQSVITQNIDGLHHKAGNKNVYELHGNLNCIFCQKCRKEDTIESFFQKAPCPSCGGLLRPGVILFGEGLPEEAWEGAVYEIKKAKLLLVIGTSLLVSPVNQLPLLMGQKDKKILINHDPTPLNHLFNIIFKERAGEVLGRIQETLMEE